MHALLIPSMQLREVLEKFLDDDSDMKDLNLTAKVRAVEVYCIALKLDWSEFDSNGPN